MPLLDTLEAWFIPKPQQRPLSPSAKWFAPPLPDRDLKGTDFYDISLYLRCAWAMVARLIFSYTIFWVVGLIVIILDIWHSYPILFHMGRMQARVWHGLWKVLGPGLFAKQFYLIPLAPLVLALFSLILYLLRALFWNRRARRLLAAGAIAQAEAVVAITTPDASVWPPPPSQSS